MRRGRPIEEGVTRGGVHRGGEQLRHLHGIRLRERDPSGRQRRGDVYRATEGRVGCSGGDFLARELGSRRAPLVSMAPPMVSRGERNGWGPGSVVTKRRRRGWRWAADSAGAHHAEQWRGGSQHGVMGEKTGHQAGSTEWAPAIVAGRGLN
jgi:hypothetical protein